MTKKLEIIVFGLRDQTLGGGCGCSGGECGPVETIGEMYDKLVQYIESSDIKDNVNLKFIDFVEDDMTGYEYARHILKQGLVMPLIAFDGEVKFYGLLSNSIVYQEAKRLLAI